jgi:hypothetical protein
LSNTEAKLEQSQEETLELRRQLENANSKLEAQQRENFRIGKENQTTDSGRRRERGVRSVETSQQALDKEMNRLQSYLGPMPILNDIERQIDQEIDRAELCQLWATVRDLVKDFCHTMYHEEGTTAPGPEATKPLG